MFAIKVETPSDDVKGVGRKWIFDGVEKERRTRVARAVRRGEAVADPDDAPLAVEFAQSLTKRSRWHWIGRLSAVVVFLYLAVALGLALVRDTHHAFPSTATIVLFLYVAVHAYGWFQSRRFLKNARRAEEVNLRLLGDTPDKSLAPETLPQSPSNSHQDASVPSKRQQYAVWICVSVAFIAYFAMAPEKYAEGIFFMILAVCWAIGVAKALDANPPLKDVERLTLWWWLGTCALILATAATHRTNVGIATAVSMTGLGLFIASNMHGVADQLSTRVTGFWIFRTKMSARDWRLNGLILAIFAPIWASNLSQYM